MKLVVRRERELVPRLRESVGEYRGGECGVFDFVFQELPQPISILQRAFEVGIVAAIDDLLPVEQPGHRQRVWMIEGVVDAGVQRGVVRVSIALDLLKDDGAEERSAVGS
jgi:hypothetical protein